MKAGAKAARNVAKDGEKVVKNAAKGDAQRAKTAAKVDTERLGPGSKAHCEKTTPLLHTRCVQSRQIVTRITSLDSEFPMNAERASSTQLPDGGRRSGGSCSYAPVMGAATTQLCGLSHGPRAWV